MQKRGFVVRVFEKEKLSFAEVGIIFSDLQEDCGTAGNTGACSQCGCNCAGKAGIMPGKTVTALNKTGKKLQKGNLVEFQIKKEHLIFQLFFNLILPLILAILSWCAAAYFSFSEEKSILLAFAGLAAGIGLAFILKRIKTSFFLPEITGVCS